MYEACLEAESDEEIEKIVSKAYAPWKNAGGKLKNSHGHKPLGKDRGRIGL